MTVISLVFLTTYALGLHCELAFEAQRIHRLYYSK